MSISLIVAYDKNRGIGKGNALPWAGKIPRDMKRFKELTTGHVVIMGRSTFESIGRPLPQRENIVLSRDEKFTAHGIRVVHSVAEAVGDALLLADRDKEIFVIGGAQVYNDMLPHVDTLYITEICETFACDTFFPAYTADEWTRKSMQVFHGDEKNAFKMLFYRFERKTAS